MFRIFIPLLLVFQFLNVAYGQQEDNKEEYAQLPSPLQIVFIFQNPDMQFDSTLLHTYKDANAYESNYRQLLNFGVYTADLAFSIQNDEMHFAKNYLEALNVLGKKNGLNSIFDQLGMQERFEKSMDNKDSVISILLDLSMSIESYLENNEMMYVASVQFAGAWVEGIYLASKIAVSKDKPEITKVILEQFSILSNIVQVLKSIKESHPFHAKVVTQLSDLEETMNTLKSVKKFVKKNQNNGLTQEELNLVLSKITAIRMSIITPS